MRERERDEKQGVRVYCSKFEGKMCKDSCIVSFSHSNSWLFEPLPLVQKLTSHSHSLLSCWVWNENDVGTVTIRETWVGTWEGELSAKRSRFKWVPNTLEERSKSCELSHNWILYRHLEVVLCPKAFFSLSPNILLFSYSESFLPRRNVRNMSGGQKGTVWSHCDCWFVSRAEPKEKDHPIEDMNLFFIEDMNLVSGRWVTSLKLGTSNSESENWDVILFLWWSWTRSWSSTRSWKETTRSIKRKRYREMREKERHSEWNCSCVNNDDA